MDKKSGIVSRPNNGKPATASEREPQLCAQSSGLALRPASDSPIASICHRRHAIVIAVVIIAASVSTFGAGDFRRTARRRRLLGTG